MIAREDQYRPYRIQRLYIETAPLIYYVEEHPAYLAKMDALIAAVEETPLDALSATLVVTEVLVQPLKQGNAKLVQQYRNLLLNSADLRLVPLTTTIAEKAARLRAVYNLKTPDALHLATALETGCDAFLTNDLGLKRVAELKILVLDELELPTKDTAE